MLSLINAILGGALLVSGRKLFWLFVGVTGFAAGILLTNRFWHGPEWLEIVIGLAFGLLFAFLAIFIQSIAIGAAGFLAGGYVLLGLATLFGLDKGALAWILYIVGGILGVVLVSLLFDWALITLSSLAGASMIVDAFHLQRAAGGLILMILVIIGVAIQGSALHSERHKEKPND